MLPKDLEELQARGKLNISEEPGSIQHQVWAKEGEGEGSGLHGAELCSSHCVRVKPPPSSLCRCQRSWDPRSCVLSLGFEGGCV